ncbi:MAG: hypothetical protein OQK68_01035, partial [Sedimenticola sp.]|nr:hypothetical protein [Sedimenticola sp.]
MKKSYLPFIGGLAVFLMTLLVTLIVEKIQTKGLEQHSRNETLTYLSAVRARLEGTFNSTLYLSR